MVEGRPTSQPEGRLADTEVSEKHPTTVPKPVGNFPGVSEGRRIERRVEDGRVMVDASSQDWEGEFGIGRWVAWK